MRKRKMAMKENDKKTIKINIAMSILLVVVLSFISVGYALYGQVLNISGRTTLKPQGKLAIKNVELLSSKNVKDGSIPAFTDDSVDFNLTFEKPEGSTEEGYQAVYSISIENGTFYDYEFNLANFQPVITNSSGINVDPSYLTFELDGINIGDTIPALETVTFTLTMNFNPEEDDTYSVDGNLDTDDVLEEQPHGSLLGSIPDNATGDLRESLDNNITSVTITVINTYQSPRTFTLSIGDTDRFVLVDSSGNALGSLTIEGGKTETYTIYIIRKSGATFASDSLVTNISLSYSDVTNQNCGSITILVDKEEIKDTTPPIITDISATIQDATSDDTTNTKVGSVRVTWQGRDPESGVKKYYIMVYPMNNGTPDTPTTYEQDVSEGTSYTVTGLADGSYMFKVYGENIQGYKPETQDVSSCSSDYCKKTSEDSYTWHFTVSLSDNSSNIKSISPTAVNRGKNLTATIEPSDSTGGCYGTTYTLTNTATVTMGGSSISSTESGEAGHYRYNVSNNSGTLNVYAVTGDIIVTASATASRNS